MLIDALVAAGMRKVELRQVQRTSFAEVGSGEEPWEEVGCLEATQIAALLPRESGGEEKAVWEEPSRPNTWGKMTVGTSAGFPPHWDMPAPDYSEPWVVPGRGGVALTPGGVAQRPSEAEEYYQNHGIILFWYQYQHQCQHHSLDQDGGVARTHGGVA